MSRDHLHGAVLCVLFLFAATCGADEFHYNNILIGDRASGMGGAYTAISDDPSGMYYNPAGIAYSIGKNLSASVNAYNVSKRTYKGVIGGQDWTRTSSTLLPNFFGIIQPVGKVKLGFSYAVPDSNQEDQDQSFKYSFDNWGSTTHVINFNNNNTTNLFGPSAALQLSDTFSVGTTLYVHLRNTEAIFNSTKQSDDKKYHEWVNEYRESDEFGIKPIIGVMWTPVDKLSLGAAVSKTVILKSEVLQQSNSSTALNQSFDNTNGPVVLDRNNESLATSAHKRTYPYQVTAGAAYFANSSLLISGDLSYFSAYDFRWIDGVAKRRAVINGAIGTEYFLNKNWALRGGLFTDFANTPAVMEGVTDQLEHIDMFGGSMSLSHFTKNTSISFGGNYKAGSGKSQIFGENIQNATASNWSVFVSSSYSY